MSSSVDDDVRLIAEMLKRAVSFDNVTVYADRSTEPSSQSSAMDHPLPAGDMLQQHRAGTTSPRTGTPVATKKLCIVMVGLPARGKTHIAQCLERYLNWLGFSTSVFNAGHYRRAMLGGTQPANFFDPKNEEGARARMELAMECLNDMIRWFGRGGLVGIYDATNTTKKRRKMVRERLGAAGVRVLFLESLCTDRSIVDKNIIETKLHSPDYRNADPELAAADFSKRIEMYESVSETIEENEQCSYIKVVNVGRQIILNDIQGYTQSKIVSFLLNTHITPRSVYLSRHGESEWNVTGQIGGDPPLTARGQVYARKLAEFIRNEFADKADQTLQVWTSQLQRTKQTAELIPALNLRWRALNEIDAGICEGLTYEAVADKHPEVARDRKRDKLRYRYPGGESYVDVIHRLEPVILEIERQRGPVLVIAHNAIIRSIYAYLTGKSQQECPFIEVPLHTVFKLTTRAYGAKEKRFPMDVDSTCQNTTPEAGDSDNEDAKQAVANQLGKNLHSRTKTLG